ncbi:MAG: hypothetical protein R3F39_09545 [Myxococcota bacterium]
MRANMAWMAVGLVLAVAATGCDDGGGAKADVVADAVADAVPDAVADAVPDAVADAVPDAVPDADSGVACAPAAASCATTGCCAGSTCTGGICVADVVATCVPTATSDLAGVKLALTTTDCTYTLAEAAAGITIAWEVVTDAPVAEVASAPQDAGGCSQADASGLMVFPRVSGGAEAWCICDSGLCQGPDGSTVTLPAGTVAGSFDWDGVNWIGPSDTGNPKGAPFPPGAYTVSLSAKGTASGTPFEVRLEVPITLVP